MARALFSLVGLCQRVLEFQFQTWPQSQSQTWLQFQIRCQCQPGSLGRWCMGQQDDDGGMILVSGELEYRGGMCPAVPREGGREGGRGGGRGGRGKVTYSNE